MAIFQTKFGFRDKVAIDGDPSLKGFVTAFQCRETREPICEVSYVHNGAAVAGWFEEWRLELVEAAAPCR